MTWSAMEGEPLLRLSFQAVSWSHGIRQEVENMPEPKAGNRPPYRAQ